MLPRKGIFAVFFLLMNSVSMLSDIRLIGLLMLDVVVRLVLVSWLRLH